MPGSKHAYLLSTTASSPEMRRLQNIDEFMGPTTEGRIDRLGIGRGWRCLEVGTGAGGVARWMARRVGPEGKVTAIDLNPLIEFDEDLPQLEIRRHDILAEGLENDFYDLVHCRLLLINVGDARLALQRMVHSLRPGGWLIVEEPGESRFPAVGEENPRIAEFHRLAELFLQSLQQRTNAIELDLYRRLPALLEEVGLTAIAGELTSQFDGSHARAAFLGTIQAVRPLLAETPFARDGNSIGSSNLPPIKNS